MIDADELADMKATQNLTMTETVYIQELTETSNSAGGHTQAWNTTVTTVGRIVPSGKSAEEREFAARLGSVQGYTITLPADTVVTNKHRLQINGRNYEIVGTLIRSNQTALRVVCMEVL